MVQVPLFLVIISTVKLGLPMCLSYVEVSSTFVE